MSSNFIEMMEEAIGDRQESSLLTEAQFIRDIALLHRIKRSKALFIERDVDIFFRRYGLHGYEKHSFKEIGDFYSLHHERPRQICAKFMRIIKGRYMTREWIKTGRPLAEIINRINIRSWKVLK